VSTAAPGAGRHPGRPVLGPGQVLRNVLPPPRRRTQRGLGPPAGSGTQRRQAGGAPGL